MLKQIVVGIVLFAGLLVGTAWGDEALNSALFEAVKSGNKAQVMALIAKGAGVNAKDVDGCTPLHLAADYGRKAEAELLIAKGADVNAKCLEGLTPLEMVKIQVVVYESEMSSEDRREYMDVAELLISRGAK